MTVRDFQRGKVYKAEQQFRKADLTFEFSGMAEMVRFKDEVLAEPWFRTRFPMTSGRGLKIELLRSNANGLWAYADSDNRRVQFPSKTSRSAWAYRPETLLHEIAHVCIDDHRTREVADHGTEFTAVMVDLISYFVGSGQELTEFRRLYRANGVRVGTYVQFLPPAMRSEMVAALRGVDSTDDHV